MQLYTLYFICKLLYMFRVVSPPIIRSTKNVFTASGTGQPLLLPVAIVEELRLYILRLYSLRLYSLRLYSLNSYTIATGSRKC